jgi:UDP-2,3-diacylglucosamine pyrophosphatase LpxH
LPEKTQYRSVWISDVHLCTKDSRAEELYDFLDGIRCDYLYLVGDIIDVWALRRKWHWPPMYNEVMHKLLKRSRHGAEVIYIPGNHDDFFRSFVGYTFGDIRVVQNARHETADGRQFLVLHGDEFDMVVKHHLWLAALGSRAYRRLITLNRMVNAVRRRLGKPYWSFSGAIKRRVKQAVSYVNRFEEILVSEARRHGVDGIICGHIHQPLIREIDGVLYCNAGDWVENCTALVEHQDGRLELLRWHEDGPCQARRDAEDTPIASTRVRPSRPRKLVNV